MYIIANLVDVKRYHTAVLTCISLKTNDLEHFFTHAIQLYALDIMEIEIKGMKSWVPFLR